MKSTGSLILLLVFSSFKGHTQSPSPESVIRYRIDSVMYFSNPVQYNYNGMIIQKPTFHNAIKYYKVGNGNAVFKKNEMPRKYDFLSQYNQCLSCQYKYAQQVDFERAYKNNLAHNMHYSYGEPLFYTYRQNAIYNQPWNGYGYAYNNNVGSFAGLVMVAALYQLFSSKINTPHPKKKQEVHHETHRRHHLIPAHSYHNQE